MVLISGINFILKILTEEPAPETTNTTSTSDTKSIDGDKLFFFVYSLYKYKQMKVKSTLSILYLLTFGQLSLPRSPRQERYWAPQWVPKRLKIFKKVTPIKYSNSKLGVFLIKCVILKLYGLNWCVIGDTQKQ